MNHQTITSKIHFMKINFKIGIIIGEKFFSSL